MSKQLPTDRHLTYQIRYNRCYRPGCACAKDTNKRHGPYLYVMYREDGTLKSGYIRKATPEDERAVQNARLRRVRAKLKPLPV